jgi:biotin carboxyl carrier protein
MAKAFTPGLTVSARVTYRARRILPIAGEVRVAVGDAVDAGTVVAETFMEGDAFPIKAANLLGANPKDLPGLMLVKVGDPVRKDQPIARSKGIFGMMKVEAKSSADGTVESVSDSSGMVIVRGPRQPIAVRAYVTGRVAEVIRGEGAVVEAQASLVQGIFGVGGEAHGPVAVACASASEELDADDIDASMAGAVVVGGACMTASAIAKARQVGAAAIVSGGIDDQDLRDVLGHDIGVAVTGSERLGITLIVTEGFGDIAMATRTFELLVSHRGRVASVNGATQIRAGVLRPEVVVPLEAGAAGAGGHAAVAGGATAGVLEVGTPVRIIRDPHFGVLGTVAALPEQPAVLGSGSKARVLEVATVAGQRLTVPRANVELIEG